MERKAKFHLTSEAADSRTTVVKVKSIQLEGESEIYQFPPELQSRGQHKKLFEHTIIKGVVKSLTSRNKFRNVNITLRKGELLEDYLDEEGNVVFCEYYLEAEISPPSPSSQALVSEKSIHTISKDMVLGKYNGKNFNAETWIIFFEKECERLSVHNIKYSEILRIFVEDAALDWYTIFLKSHNLTYPWESWRASFVNTFGQRSWSEIEYAYMFKYLGGSFLDYALKKRSLLLDVDPDLTIKSQMNLIVISLPKYVKHRLEKRDLTNIDDFMSKLRQIEPVKIKANMSSTACNEEKPKINMQEYCGHCEKIGFPGRRHSEKVCRLKISKLIKNDKIKIANNVEAQNAISFNEDSKNEL